MLPVPTPIDKGRVCTSCVNGPDDSDSSLSGSIFGVVDDAAARGADACDGDGEALRVDALDASSRLLVDAIFVNCCETIAALPDGPLSLMGILALAMGDARANIMHHSKQ